MVKDIAVDAAGGVSFTFVLTREDPGSLARQARKAVEGVAGVTAVKMSVVDSADSGAQSAVRPSGRPAAQPVPPAPPTPNEMPGLGKVLAVADTYDGAMAAVRQLEPVPDFFLVFRADEEPIFEPYYDC